MVLKTHRDFSGIVSVREILAAEPTSERRSCEENRARDLQIPPAKNHRISAPPPKLNFARAIPPATQATQHKVSCWLTIKFGFKSGTTRPFNVSESHIIILHGDLAVGLLR